MPRYVPSLLDLLLGFSEGVELPESLSLGMPFEPFTEEDPHLRDIGLSVL